MNSQQVMAIADACQAPVYSKFPLSLERGAGSWVYTAEGRRFLDLYGGHAVAIAGHCHPRIVEALRRQSEKLVFYSNLAYNSERAMAARQLINVAPRGIEQVFFVNSGAEANENAIQMARRMTGRSGLISFQGGFHGRTSAALSATGLDSMSRLCRPAVPGHHLAPFGDLQAVERLMSQFNIAAILLEPVQSMAGVQMAEAGFYQGLRRLCDQSGAFLIYDEVQTGMGRCGDFFFAPRHGVIPDLMTLAKGLAGGVPAGALLIGERIAGRIGKGDLGSTFGGAPLVCAAIRATLDVIEEENLLDNVRRQSDDLKQRCLELPQVAEVRGLGFLIGIRLTEKAAPVQDALFHQGILTGLSSHPSVLRLLPPLNLQRLEIDLFLDSFANVLQAVPTPA